MSAVDLLEQKLYCDSGYCCVRLLGYLFPFYMSRVYMHLIIISHIAHTLLVFRFTSLQVLAGIKRIVHREN